MKNLRLVILPILIVLIISSCGKKEEEVPEYVGDWGSLYDDFSFIDTMLYQHKEYMYIDKGTFERTILINQNNGFIEKEKLEGDIEVDTKNGLINFIIKKYWSSYINPNTNYFTGELYEINILSDFPNPSQRTDSYNYSLEDKELTLFIFDYSDDGDYEDYLESRTFFQLK